MDIHWYVAMNTPINKVFPNGLEQLLHIRRTHPKTFCIEYQKVCKYIEGILSPLRGGTILWAQLLVYSFPKANIDVGRPQSIG